MCEEHPRLLFAFNESSEESHDEGPLWQAYAASRDAITAARPRTLAGVIAKALAAKAEAELPDGSESPDGTLGVVWAWDVLNELCRMHEISQG